MKYCGDGKFINCEDCGRLIKVSKSKVRCNECQSKYRKQQINNNSIRYYYNHTK